MGGLDHSFIKAYNPSATAAASQVGTDDEPVSGSVVAPTAQAADARSRYKPPTPHAPFGSPRPAAAAQPARVAQMAAEPSIGSSVADSWMVSVSTLDALAPPAAVMAPPAAASKSMPSAATVSAPAPVRPMPEPRQHEAPPRPHLFQTAPLPASEAFRPLLEVDHFLWPELMDDLAKRVSEPLRELAAEFSAASAAGCRTLLFVGHQAGCGVTSVLLAAARQLARHGLKVALVDANFARPDLARYLGIAPQIGWEDVMTRHAALPDALVESLADQLTLLPLKEPVALAESPLDLSMAPENLKQLRRHFDLVLVDGGSLADRSTQRVLERLGNGAIEGIVGVRDWRTTPKALELVDSAANRLVDRLQIGVIENFAA